jgi:class 3 adenylate cyclase/TolB-like protein/Tfp pilus assembly protein PilF
VTNDGAEGSPERRLAAILVADVVGYSRLMGANEEGTLAKLRALRSDLIDPALAQHHGRLVKTVGDGLLVEFASVVDALRAAVEWQNAMRQRNADVPENQRIVFRIGINLGDVIVDGDDIYGDGVNVAARLEGLAKPGTICLSRAARDQVRDKFPFEFERMGELRVKNIARPVQSFLVRPDATRSRLSRLRMRAGGPWRRPALATALVLLLAVAGSIGWFATWGPGGRRDPDEAASSARESLPLPDKPSIAVLPFDNLGGDSERLGLSEVLADSIISSLSKIPKMFVISRNSTFTYKGTPVSVAKVSRELGVRYVLEGSVQKSGAKVRITARLVDAVSGFHVWSEIFDRDLDNIFALQDEITLNVVTALQIELTQGELTHIRQRGTKNLRAWLLVNQSFEHLMRFTREGNAQARKLAEEAIALDPGYPEAYVRLARTHLSDFQIGGGSDPKSLERSIELAQQALALDDSYPDTYVLLSAIYLFLKRHDDAGLAISKALDLSPNHPLAKAHLGMILNYSGQPETAINVLKEAMRLSPIYPDWFLSELARAYFLTGRYNEAIDALQRRLQHDPKSGEALILLAASESAAGRLDNARRALAKFLEPRLGYTLDHYARGEFYRRPGDLKLVLDALRSAGLPD